MNKIECQWFVGKVCQWNANNEYWKVCNRKCSTLRWCCSLRKERKKFYKKSYRIQVECFYLLLHRKDEVCTMFYNHNSHMTHLVKRVLWSCATFEKMMRFFLKCWKLNVYKETTWAEHWISSSIDMPTSATKEGQYYMDKNQTAEINNNCPLSALHHFKLRWYHQIWIFIFLYCICFVVNLFSGQSFCIRSSCSLWNICISSSVRRLCDPVSCTRFFRMMMALISCSLFTNTWNIITNDFRLLNLPL